MAFLTTEAAFVSTCLLILPVAFRTSTIVAVCGAFQAIVGAAVVDQTAGTLASHTRVGCDLGWQVIQVQSHLDGTGAVRHRRVILGVAKLVARIFDVGFGQVLLEQVVEPVL